MNNYESFHWIFSALLVIIPSTLVTLVLLWIVRKNVSRAKLHKHHDVAGYLFSIIGVLYSVILGFTVINVQERYNRADETVQTEATIVTDLYRDAIYFDAKSVALIRANLKKYVTYVIDQEWGVPHDAVRRLKADEMLQDLWRGYETVELENDRSKIWYELTIAKLDHLMEIRLAREFYSWETLSDMMWTILILGAVITICFMFFFGLENLRMQMLMTSLLTIYLAFMLYLVFSLDHVFEGTVHITPQAFKETLLIFERLDQASTRP